MQKQKTGRGTQNQMVLPLLVILIGGAIGVYFGLKDTSGASAPTDPSQAPTVGTAVTADDDAVLGDPKAPVTMIEFSDYQCPFCKRFKDETLGALKTKYIDTGKVKLVYRDFPLGIHPYAQKAAEAAECAGDQGKYYEMHDAIFVKTPQLAIEDLKLMAQEIGLNTATFNTCLDNGTHADEVKKDMSDGTAAGVTATPSFFINGTLLRGAQPTAAFEAAIEQAL